MKVEFCKFLDRRQKDGSIALTPIGKAKNAVKNPILPGWKTISTDIVINKRFTKGLDGIEDYSHIIVVYWMHKEKECHLKHHPQGKPNIPYLGIFACRCPQRPNRIAISTVKLLERKGNTLRVQGLDIISGTPILDIKPYTPQYDHVDSPQIPAWVNRLVF